MAQKAFANAVQRLQFEEVGGGVKLGVDRREEMWYNIRADKLNKKIPDYLWQHYSNKNSDSRYFIDNSNNADTTSQTA